MKRIVAVFAVVMLVLSLCACAPKESEDFSVSIQPSYGAPAGKEDILEFADAIIHATVVKKSNEYFTNPDGEKKTEDGYDVQNLWVTEYEVEIHEQFTGEPLGDTMTVCSYNGSGQSADQYVPDAESDFYLKEGECVLALTLFADEGGNFGTGPCYISMYDGESYFLPTENAGEFASHTGVTFSLEELQNIK